MSLKHFTDEFEHASNVLKSIALVVEGRDRYLCGTMRTMERVRPLIRHHHEKLDGSGYPDHLAGKEIPLLVRIITAVDVYDAVMSIMREEVATGWWDRDIVDMLDPARSASQPA